MPTQIVPNDNERPLLMRGLRPSDSRPVPTWGKRLYRIGINCIRHRTRTGYRRLVMDDPLRIVCLARHGETAWSLTGQHTGMTDLPLTEHGERNARRLGGRLRGLTFAGVFTSPLQRALRTCELAGFGDTVEVDPDLVEWNYGDYEGRRTADIQLSVPVGSFFAMAVQEARRLRTSLNGRTAS